MEAYALNTYLEIFFMERLKSMLVTLDMGDWDVTPHPRQRELHDLDSLSYDEAGHQNK